MPEFAWREWVKPHKISVMTVHALAEIRTRYLPYTSQITLTILLGKYILKSVSKEQFHYKI